jgi:hypothetical protein
MGGDYQAADSIVAKTPNAELIAFLTDMLLGSMMGQQLGGGEAVEARLQRWGLCLAHLP